MIWRFASPPGRSVFFSSRQSSAADGTTFGADDLRSSKKIVRSREIHRGWRTFSRPGHWRTLGVTEFSRGVFLSHQKQTELP